MPEDSLYLDNIQEYVQDENKIVTCKWLSRTLSVPVNAAKKMLFSYVAKQRASGSQLVVTYIVTGVANKEDNCCCHKVCLVEEDDLEASKKQFSEVWGVHIYSVQKAKLKDLATLYAADFDARKDNLMDYSKWSTIDPKQFERLSLSSKTYVSKLPSEKVESMEMTSKGSRGTELTSKGTELTSKGTELTSKGTERTSKGTELTSKGTELTSKGTELTSKGTELTSKGSELTSKGASKRPHPLNPKLPRLSHMVPELPELPNIQPQGPSPADQSAPVLAEATTKQVSKAVESKKAPLKGSVASFFASVKESDKTKSSAADKGSVSTGAGATEATLKSPKKTAPSEPTLVTSSKASPVKGAKNQPKKPHKSPHKSPHTSPHKAVSKSPRKWGALNFSMEPQEQKSPVVLHDSDIESEHEDGVESIPQAKVSKVERPATKKRMKGKKVMVCPEAEQTVEVVQRKRRRVQNMSSDEDGSSDDEAPVLEEAKVAVSAEKKKKRVKRLVSKMYTTEDGSLVTERVMESFSEDDCEPEPHAQPSPKKAPPSLQKANQTIDSKKGTKQASLTSFFIK